MKGCTFCSIFHMPHSRWHEIGQNRRPERERSKQAVKQFFSALKLNDDKWSKLYVSDVASCRIPITTREVNDTLNKTMKDGGLVDDERIYCRRILNHKGAIMRMQLAKWMEEA